MSEGFTKLYGTRLLSSTLWLECWQARLVFVSMLAAADANGVVDAASVRVLARIVNLSVEDTQAGLAVLEAPDPDSRTPDEDGRRVVREGNGWRVVNHRKYREVQTKAQVQAAVRSKRSRAKVRGVTKRDDRDASRASRRVRTEAEAEAEAETEAEAEREGETRAGRAAPGPAAGQLKPLAKAQPSRLRAHLEECVRAEFGKFEEPSQKAATSQWVSACERLQEALNLGKFPGAQAACEALATAAVAEARRPGGRDLGFALQRVPFVPGRVVPLGVVVRGLDAEEGV